MWVSRFFIAALGCALLALSSAHAQEPAGTVVGMWDRFELTLSNTKPYASPYRDVELSVQYTRPDGSSFSFWGFYDGEQTWKARMVCDAPGDWQYLASFSDGEPGASGSFSCVPSSIPGMLGRDEANPRWLGFKGGQHRQFRSLHVGDRFFASNWPEQSRLDFLSWAKQQGYNMLSIASHMPNWKLDGRGNGWDTPVLWPLDAAEYREMESILDLLAEEGFSVFGFAGFFGKLQDNVPQNATDQALYVRYLMARIGSYWNLLLCVMGPEMNRHPDAGRLGSLVDQYNVFDHLLGLHPFDDEYGQISAKPWSSLVVVQGLEMSTSNLPAFLDNMYAGLVGAYVPGKPVYAHETLWPGNTLQPDYSSPDAVRKIGWTTLMAGATLNYGDMAGNSSTGFSGTMDLADKVQWRHDVMKKIWDFFETIAFYRMDPCPGRVDRGYCLGETDREYLVYLPQRGAVNLALSGGNYLATWINAADTSDRVDLGLLQSGGGLTPPARGDDWLLHLIREDLAAPPRIAFSRFDQTITESVGTVTVELKLSRVSSSPVIVPIIVDGSASADVDYLPPAASITIPAGELRTSIAVPIVDDAEQEEDEFLDLRLGTPEGAEAGSPSVHRLSILDDDGPPRGTLQFSEVQYIADEADSVASLTLTRVGGSHGAASVTIEARAGTALPDEDYVALHEVVSWADGDDSSKVVHLNLITDQLDEPDEALRLELSSAIGATIAEPSTSELLIVDDDNPPAGTVQFGSGSYSVNEGAGSVSISVTRSGGSFGAASVAVATADDSALSGADYAPVSQILQWADGDNSPRSVVVPILNDSLVESTESFRLILSGAQGVLPGGPASATVNITDNDTAVAADTTPDKFSFKDLSGVKGKTDIISNTVTVSGLGSGVSTTLKIAKQSGGKPAFSINSGAFGTTAVKVKNGDQVRLRNRVTSSNGSASVTLSIGGVTDTWTIKTSR